MEVQIALNRLQINRARRADFRGVIGLQLVHHLTGARDDPRDTALAHKHVMRLFGEHKFRGARERIKTTFGECAQLEFAIAIGEIREHEKRQPVRRFFVERAEDARVVGIARVTLQQRIGFFAAIAAKVFVQQIDHRPEVTALFHVNLEKIAKVVHRRRGQPKVTLLLDRRGLRIALSHDNAAQIRAMFARHVLPRGFALVFAEVDIAAFFLWVHENAPTVVGHFDVTKLRPTGRINAHCRAQIHVVIHRAFGTHVVPPRKVVWLPMLKRALQRFVFRQVHVVGDFFAVVNTGVHLGTPIYFVIPAKAGIQNDISINSLETDLPPGFRPAPE